MSSILENIARDLGPARAYRLTVGPEGRSEHGKNPAGASKFGERREDHFHFAAAFRRGKNFRDGGAGKAAVEKPVETDDARGERGGLSGARFSC